MKTQHFGKKNKQYEQQFTKSNRLQNDGSWIQFCLNWTKAPP